MNLCINPDCNRPENLQEELFCQACDSELLIAGQYRVIKRLSKQGGFGQTYEVRDNRTLKVMKILAKDSDQVVELFQREAEILSQLNCSGIPKGEAYFTYFPANSKTPLHCLVMEKIEGMDLETYQEKRNNRPVDEIVAFKWLKQILEILDELHSYNLFHRDIKPSNIILRPDGNLALIDFGAVRQITATIVGGESSTKIYTPGYAPPEQEKGYAVPQSDFYALGRTLVYLLSGKSPTDTVIYDLYNNKLNWRKYAQNLDSDFADLIDFMMQESAALRPKNVQSILQEMAEIGAKKSKYKSIINTDNKENSAVNNLAKNITAERAIALNSQSSEERTTRSQIVTKLPAGASPKSERKIQQFIQKSLINKIINLKTGLIFAAILAIIGIFNSLKSDRAEFTLIPETEIDIYDRQPHKNKFKLDWISQGDRVLLRGRGNRFRDLGIEAFNQQRYAEAIDLFAKGVQSNRNDPEVQIYLNNARARLAGNSLKIATVVPIDSQQASSEELLRGVADAQTKFNEAGGIDGRLVEVIIANDDDKPERAAQIAREIVKNSEILAVVGHNSSGATKAGLAEYQKAGMPVVSPVSSSIYLASDVFFRTILSDFESGRKLAEYTKNSLKIARVAVFYNENSTYSKSLLRAFEENFDRKGGQIIAAIDISDPKLNPQKEIKTLRGKVEAIALFPRTVDISTAVSLARANLELPGKKFKTIGGDTLYSSDTLNSGGLAVNGLVLAVPWFSENQPYAKLAASRWLGTVNWRTATSYDATLAVLSSLSERSTRQSVLENLKQVRISAAESSGEALRFSPTGERQGDPVLVRVSTDTSNRPRGTKFGFQLIRE
ncbi:MAG: bifunctional serine/threonine-protein kinase/ABC transporter substrate-binding protein [Prochloraceae cyanobacterium]|nr:bifunctional serine/threonine-protein kinase/ABC transporter substrate-binding protein [Prochloraceae cyanobacterium]